MLTTLRYIWSHPLARHSRARALSRYFRWQLATRILDWPTVAPFVDEAKLVVERGMHGATGNVFCGLHEFPDMSFLLHLLRPEDVFVDIGANVGSYTVLASAVVGATTVSIEPVAEAHAWLQRNIRLNNIENLVTVAYCAAGRQAETRRISLDRGTENRFVAENYQGPACSVNVKQIDSLLQDRPSTLWKIDVEGFEMEALEGARESLANDSLLAIIIETGKEEVARMLGSFGFQRAAYDPFHRELKEKKGPQTTNNQLWVRDADAVTARCKQARKYQVLSVSF